MWPLFFLWMRMLAASSVSVKVSRQPPHEHLAELIRDLSLSNVREEVSGCVVLECCLSSLSDICLSSCIR